MTAMAGVPLYGSLWHKKKCKKEMGTLQLQTSQRQQLTRSAVAGTVIITIVSVRRCHSRTLEFISLFFHSCFDEIMVR